MLALFLGISAINILMLAITTALGYGVARGHPWGAYHQLVGVLAAMVCCGVHCVVFTYFIATAKWVQHAIDVRNLPAELLAPTRSFRAQAFPAALAAMASVCLAAFVGAATFSYRFSPIYHHGCALLALVVNALAATIEYRAISRNGKLVDRVLAEMAGKA